jgi:surface polysaccharide O-acyltransferase-like enzyme
VKSSHLDIHLNHSSSRLAHLDSLRALAICLVVAIHARGYVHLGDDAEGIIGPAVLLIGVPVFFLCDGFLFVHGRLLTSQFDYGSYLLASARRLLVPWVIFSALYLGARIAFESIGVLSERAALGRAALPLLLGVYGSKFAPQMYFLLSLFLIRMLANLFRYLATAPVFVVWMIFAVYAVVFHAGFQRWLTELLTMDLDPVRHAFWGLQFYFLGALLARHQAFIDRMPLAFAAAAAVALGLTLALGGLQSARVLVQYAYLLAAYLFFLAATSPSSTFSRFGRDSMGIYLLHAPVLLNGISIVIGALFAQPLLAYLVLVGGTTSAAYALTRVIRLIPHGPLIFGEFPKARA